MVTIMKCQCGDSICNRYGLSDGMFYQGCGWEKERAQQYADAINAYDALPDAENQGHKDCFICDEAEVQPR